MKEEEEKCCGNCCWFYGEMIDGDGFCIMQKGEIDDVMYCCSKCCDLFVSRQEMRHHMYVLLAVKYWFDGNHHHNVSPHEMHEAMAFAYKYMKTFSEL